MIFKRPVAHEEEHPLSTNPILATVDWGLALCSKPTRRPLIFRNDAKASYIFYVDCGLRIQKANRMSDPNNDNNNSRVAELAPSTYMFTFSIGLSCRRAQPFTNCLLIK